ncbi:MAG: disulfide bond formation protein B [Chlamydiales bacterium]|nr:disulfide bond formation protein B [Chlamydiales bacterium]
MRIIRNNGLYFAWFISLVGVMWSFYWSERLNLELCSLCWMQRVFLFPLAIILGIGTYRQDRGVIIYAMPLAIVGAFIALYHLLLQKLPETVTHKLCTSRVSCAQETIAHFGFVTPAMLSLTAFFLISLFLFAYREKA